LLTDPAHPIETPKNLHFQTFSFSMSVEQQGLQFCNILIHLLH